MSEGLQLKIAFIVIIFFISIGGACLPIVLSKSSSLFELQTSTWFTIVRCFATGIVIGVAVMHLLAESIESLAEQADYPLGLAVALIGLLFTLGIDQLTLYLLTRDVPKHDIIHCCEDPAHAESDHDHCCEVPDHSHSAADRFSEDAGHSHGGHHNCCGGEEESNNKDDGGHGHEHTDHSQEHAMVVSTNNIGISLDHDHGHDLGIEQSALKEKDTESTVNSTLGQSARDASVLHCSRPDPHRHHGCSKAEDHVHHVCEDNVVDVNVRRFKHDDCRRTTARHGETRQERSKSIELEMKQRKNESIQTTSTPQHSPSKGHSHGAEAFANVDGMSVTKLMTKAYILEAAIASHTIIIGFDFGSLDDSELSKIKILMAAFAFHQFFEGISLGTALSGAIKGFGYNLAMSLVIIFGLTFPLGILLGMYATTSGESTMVVQGCADAIAAGILMHASLVEMIPDDFTSEHANNNPKLKLGMYFALCAGVGALAILAVWA